MKAIQMTIFLFLNSVILTGQIKNNGFEIVNDSTNKTPDDWVIGKVEGFNYYLDSKVRQKGERSFMIKSMPGIEPQTFLPISQILNMDIASLKHVIISAFIKTDSVVGSAGLWCQVQDFNKKIIGFANLNNPGNIDGTNDWKKYSMDITLNSNCKTLVLGGYLQGKGTVWFDNFAIEDIVDQNIPPSKEVKRFVGNLNKVVKKNSIYSDSLNWNILYAELDYLSHGVTNIENVSFLSSYILDKLREVGDNHSFIQPKEMFDTEEKINTDGRQPSGKIIDDNIGFIYVPGFMSSSDTAKLNFATKIQNLIRTMDNKIDIQGWIIDLRENTGGNMHPMIAGLGPILGDAELGYLKNSKGKSTKWFYKNGKSGVGNLTSVKVSNPYNIKSKNSKIAVLIGPKTGSSGEMTTISFIGKPNTKLFGQNSAGYITGNLDFTLLDGSILFLASASAIDRNLKLYDKPISPDIIIEDDNKTLQTAIDWIRLE